MAVKKLKSGKWQADYHDRNNPRMRKSFKTKTEAKNWLDDLKGQRARGEQVGHDRSKIADCFLAWKEWLPEGDGHPRSPSYIKRVETAEKTLLPWLHKKGCCEVSALNIGIVREYRRFRLKAGRAQQTILNEVRTLLACLNWNYDNGWIAKNPMQNYKPGGNVEHKVRTVPTPDELQKVFDNLQNQDIKKIFYALLLLGGRFESVAALNADDILPESNRIHFKEAVKAKRDYKRSLPKFPFELPKSGYLFSNKNNRWQERAALRKLHKACDKADIERLNLHDLRHCFATYRLASGDSIQMVMALGGWRSINILNRYVDFAEDYQSLLDPQKQDGYLPFWS